MPNWKQPYTMQWSLDMQHEITPTTTMDIGYYGSVGRHLIGVIDINEPRPGAAQAAGIVPPGTPITAATTQQLNFVRPYRGYDAINQFSPVFTSNYNSLQASLQKRFGGNSALSLNYTWSKALTTSWSDYTAVQNAYDLKAEYGPTQFDRTHVFTANYIYYIPAFKSQQGFVGHTLGGWELSGILYFNSGLPLTVTGGPAIDPAGLGLLDPNSFAGRRPNMIADPNVGAPHELTQWFNTAAFVGPNPAIPVPGNAPRGAVRGPGTSRWDASLFKNTKISERFNLQFRAEASNVLNHTNWNTIRTTLQSSTFGRVLTARDPRILQLGLKLEF
jgi:hypothetical protein